ncbi:hypothetical protein AAK899_08510 [Erysipelotrichaceae bacterium 51-3]
MKKTLSLLLSGLMVFGTLVGCSSSSDRKDSSTSSESKQSETSSKASKESTASSRRSEEHAVAPAEQTPEVVDQPTVIEQPVEEPAYQEPVYTEPVYQEPVYEEPVYEEPVTPVVPDQSSDNCVDPDQIVINPDFVE